MKHTWSPYVFSETNDGKRMVHPSAQVCISFEPFVCVVTKTYQHWSGDVETLMPLLTGEWTSWVYWHRSDVHGVSRQTVALYVNHAKKDLAKRNALRLAQSYKLLLPTILKDQKEGRGVRLVTETKVIASKTVTLKRLLLADQEDEMVLQAMNEELVNGSE